MKFLYSIFVLFMTPAVSFANPSLDDLSFLEGHWRGDSGNDFHHEEIWAAPEGDVMTGMARGVSKGELRVLQYIVISEEDGAIIMRFKHFKADYSTWENPDTPIELTLTELNGADATFTANPPSHTVSAIRYQKLHPDTLKVEVALIENGEPGGFTLEFKSGRSK